MQSKATSVKAYLAALAAERRAAISAVRKIILANLDSGFEEGMQYGMIGYFVPHSVHPAGYHCDPKQPLPFAALASQKNYMSLYLMCIYGDAKLRKRFEAACAKAGKKLDMGKSCIRFNKLADLPLDAVAEAIRGITAVGYAQRCQVLLQSGKSARVKAKSSPKKTASTSGRRS